MRIYNETQVNPKRARYSPTYSLLFMLLSNDMVSEPMVDNYYTSQCFSFFNMQGSVDPPWHPPSSGSRQCIFISSPIILDHFRSDVAHRRSSSAHLRNQPSMISRIYRYLWWFFQQFLLIRGRPSIDFCGISVLSTWLYHSRTKSWIWIGFCWDYFH